MRPPRFRFPDEVRSTTRSMASRMVREETIARTPQELDAWIAERPDVREPLERGGYGTEFEADDLLPLLEVFVVQAGGAPAAASAPGGVSRGRSVVWAIVGVAVLVLAVVLVVNAVG